MSRRILPSGRAALLVECDDLDDVLALHDALDASAPDGLVELVPAARTVLVAVDPRRLPLESAASWIRRASSSSTDASDRMDAAASAEPVVVRVRYDGEDLAAVAAELGLVVDDLVARHTAARWRVAFIGFAPGFAYLVGGSPTDWPFEVRRLAAPRTRVPAGAVGLAGGFSGAYPRESPGGWRLIGRTDAPLWDASAQPPALLAPGTRVRFAAVGP
ncbi:carboxyltransferase domain-containing protein [Agromyces sp. CFH 90414]|uniref:Carboxyltransferase domain-containing protein n=1 Tax=Agromyces agglutinans TaxID=2662258 RepID=A0A6I2F7E2_9MICO|nr:allophanate hydrolase subunit 1 [Agromyces agglutinans]MRG60184.1 carboxyltransferase domain-containing protein [Agromyces agglutinans]